MSELIESILKCKVEGNTVFLPPISDGPMSNYQDVRKAFLNAGATYKRNTFVFPSDAKPFIERLTGGESVNIKKEFQFFATPAKIADQLVELAELKDDDEILEPSAGQGAIIEAILRVNPKAKVFAIELMDVNSFILFKKGFNHEVGDFLTLPNQPVYNKIIANPPFSKNQDIDHIRRMYEVCKEGGRIVSIASNHWQVSSSKKQMAFKNWLKEMNAEIIEIPRGAFKESGTTVGASIIIINK